MQRCTIQELQQMGGIRIRCQIPGRRSGRRVRILSAEARVVRKQAEPDQKSDKDAQKNIDVPERSDG